MGRTHTPAVHVGGLPIGVMSRAEWAARMIEDCKATGRPDREPYLATSANGHIVSRYWSDTCFMSLINQFDYIDADGMPLVIASRLFSTQRLPERVATTDFFHDAARAASEHGLKFFLLGATREENARALSRVRRLYPNLEVHGRNGYFRSDEEQSVIGEILEAAPDVLWIGLGAPGEHEFAVRNRAMLKGIGWIKTCGGLLNFLSGTASRAPVWMQRAGLEWAFRLVREPRRLLARYAITNVHAVYMIIKHHRT